MARTAFFISDGTGITAETLGHSLLSQFGGIKFDQVTIPYVASDDLTREAVARIDRTAQTDGATPIVFSTLVNDDHRAILHTCKGKVLDLFTAFQKPLEDELGVAANHKVGQSHAIRDQQAYRIRINAVHFALDNDDGARTRYYDQADLILVGVSRSGKTPTCLYLALQFGLFAANYPLTEDDFDDLRLPDARGRPSGLRHHLRPREGQPRLATGAQLGRQGAAYAGHRRDPQLHRGRRYADPARSGPGQRVPRGLRRMRGTAASGAGA